MSSFYNVEAQPIDLVLVTKTLVAAIMALTRAENEELTPTELVIFATDASGDLYDDTTLTLDADAKKCFARALLMLVVPIEGIAAELVERDGEDVADSLKMICETAKRIAKEVLNA